MEHLKFTRVTKIWYLAYVLLPIMSCSLLWDKLPGICHILFLEVSSVSVGWSYCLYRSKSDQLWMLYVWCINDIHICTSKSGSHWQCVADHHNFFYWNYPKSQRLKKKNLFALLSYFLWTLQMPNIKFMCNFRVFFTHNFSYSHMTISTNYFYFQV